MREADRGAIGGVRVRGEFSSSSLAPIFVGAMELDRMVIGGDWEGIVLAAAQFGGGTTGLARSSTNPRESPEPSRLPAGTNEGLSALSD